MTNSIPAAVYPKILQLIIFPTEKCNFRCTYCYETFEVGKMKRPIIEAVKKLISSRVNRGSLEALTLSWFGGEPLLASEVIYEIAEFSKQFSDSGVFRVFGGDLTTNAYLLTVPTLRKLCELKQSAFQVSLDGYGAGHDATRKYASGKGTFDVIWANLLAARKTDLDFKITLRCHMTRDNASSMEQLIDAICTEFEGDKRFNVFFKPIENLGGPNSKSMSTLGHSDAASRIKPLEQRLKEAGFGVTACIDGPESATGAGASVGVGTLLAESERSQTLSAPQKVSTAKPYEGYICYAAKPNSLIIRADGSIGKCTVLLDDPRNHVGRLNSDGTLTMDSGLVSSVWMRGFVSRDPKELGCPAQNLPKLPPKETAVKFLRDLPAPA